MPRRARIHFVSLKSSLVNLPISIYGPLLERSIRPQSLAVHLKLNESVEAYVGWTGMASASSLAHFNSSNTEETVEIDPQYAQNLGFNHGDLVEIGLLHDLGFASSVGTEPVTADDWEIIEINASHVESTLLSQVRVAKIGQEINVWVLGRTRVRLKVVSLDPQSKTDALLLTTDTEVSIAPKTRRGGNIGSAQTAASARDSTPNTNKDPQASSAPENKHPLHILRVLPSRLLPSIPPVSSPKTELIVYVAPRTLSLLTNSDYPLPTDVEDSFFRASYRYLNSPADPTEASKPTAPEPEVQPKVLTAGGKSNKEDQEDKDEKASTSDTLWIGASSAVLESHVLFTREVPGIGDWDLINVQVFASGEHKVLSDIELKVKKEGNNDGQTVPSATQPSNADQPLVGVDEILKKCTDICMANYILHSRTSFVDGIPAVLITGRPGMGKTVVARAVAKNLEQDTRTYAAIHYVDLAQYTSTPVPTLRALFRHWYEKAVWHCPVILVFDNLDKLIPPEVEHADSFRTRHIAELFVMFYARTARLAPPNFRGIVMLATAASSTGVHPLLNVKHVFQEEVSIAAPGRAIRKEILEALVNQRLTIAPKLRIDDDSPPNYSTISLQCEGYSPVDMKDLVARAIGESMSRAFKSEGENVQVVTLSAADFTVAQTGFVPLSLKDIPLQKSDIEWADIGGLKAVKRVLRETLEWPTKYAPIFRQSPLRLRSGLLLYGFPGCGKTLLASAVARECGLNFISVKGPELLNKYIGASEKSVRDIFERATAAKPCVLFFDEFDSIAPKRGHDSTGVTDRVVNQMLTQMDGAEGLEGVYVLAATSRPDLIDSALLRPGRLDKSLLCDMPDEEDRKDILLAVSRKVTLGSTVDLDEIARSTAGFSGADLQALVYNAHLEVVHASIAATSATKDGEGGRRANGAEAEPIKYVMIGGDPDHKKPQSRAEESKIQQRLQQIRASTQGSSATSKKTALKSAAKKHEITQDDLRKVLTTTRPSVSMQEQTRLRRIYSAFMADRSSDTKTKFPATPPTGVGSRSTLG
ncbi:P-loop containing nucleoside triphosphate hydrolase protein [Hygrophoropsis aurantiaca]|uniref:P-loop containing nucleoside triphosphate hydrolase protein n=1 Tax=Hygrophoropsis aurantiaca TaxID=72124 RepID=A0ACB8A6W7_9AGAM|nr:P-loop containing nucleoside triphosphate hydrolase protein [Hygrophoropsis aurantiaca]